LILFSINKYSLLLSDLRKYTMKKLFTVLLMVMFLAQLSYAQISNVIRITDKALLYEKTEFAVHLTTTWDNPYLQEDVALDMVLTSPKGKKLILPCYYESGQSGSESIWKARFAPQELGKYAYTFELSKAGKAAFKSITGSFISLATKRDGFLHPNNNWTFRFDSGKPFRGIGENIGWESRKNDDSKYFKALHENPKYNYEYMLPSLAHHGGNFYRTWISAFNLPLDWHRNFNSNRYEASDEYYNPSAIKKIDRMFTLADSLGEYVMLTLGPGNYSTRDGGFSPSSADFFVNPKSKERYKNRLRYFIARWGYSTSLGAWEFFNEVDNVQFANKNKPISADSIVQWHDEMSTYLKATDPYNHLVTTSISHRDLNGLNSLAHIDFNQKHIYKNNTAIPGTIVRYEENFKKPYVIGEYGFEWDWSKNFDEFPEGMDSDFKRGMWYGLFSPTPILPMSWWWEYFDNRGTDAYFARIKTISDEMMAAGKESFKTITATTSVKDVEVFGVKCGQTTFIYIYNPTADTKQFDLSFINDLKKAGNLTVFDCESGKSKPGKFSINKAGKAEILNQSLAAKTDAVFILKPIK